MARGNGRERACWTTADDCRINLLGAAGARSGYTGLTALHKGATSRLSDAKINSLTYSMVRAPCDVVDSFVGLWGDPE